MEMSAITMNLQSIQQCISMSTLKKAMNADAGAVSTLLSDMQAANPAPPAGRLDVRA